jgi:hypothetical protein
MITTQTLLQQESQTTDTNEALLSALLSRGIASATAYADTMPMETLVRLVEDLGLPPASAHALERALIDEAEHARTMDRCARGLLARDLRAELPDGWPATEDSDATRLIQRASAFASLAFALPKSYGAAIQRVRYAMEMADIPAGWIPHGPDDPVLMEVFVSHWEPLTGTTPPIQSSASAG